MNDSRLDQVEQTLAEAQAEPDTAKRLGLVEFAIEEWGEFADEFPATDMVIAVVTRRLADAARQLAADQTRIAGMSLQIARSAVSAVKQR